MDIITASADPGEAARQQLIEARIERFTTPTCLPAEVAARVLPRLRELARLAGPTNAQDARNLLSAGCRLIADTVPDTADMATVDVDAVLSEDTVARWSHVAKRARMNPGTLANMLRFLNRLVRARNGLPPRTSLCRPSSSPPPLPDHQRLHDLAGELAEVDPAVAGALVAAAGAGLAATSEPVTLTGGAPPTAVQGSHQVAVNACWWALARRLAGTAADPAAWGRLRAAAAARGVNLDRRVLRLRWAVDTVSAAATPRAAVQAGIPRELLNQAIAHLTPLDDATTAEALRG